MSDSHPILASKNSSMSIDICMADMKNSSSFLIEGNDCLNQEMSDEIPVESAGYLAEPTVAEKESTLRRGSEISMPDSISEDKCNNPSENSKKRARSLEDVSILLLQLLSEVLLLSLCKIKRVFSYS